MNINRKIKMVVDILMSIVLFILMSFQFTEQENHEIAGAIMFVLFIVHHIMNYKWYATLTKGKYSMQRVFLLIIDIVLLIDMIALMISGIGMSSYIFKFMNIHMSQALARNLHMILSYTGFLLMGLHIGLHYGSILGMIRKTFNITKKNDKRKIILRSITVVVALYGVYALIKRKFISYITLQMHFVFFDYNESILMYELDLLSIMILMVSIGYYTQKLLGKKKGDK